MKFQLPQFLAWLRPLWPTAVIIIAAAGALTHQLVSLAPRLSPTEQATRASSQHLPELLTNPDPLPLKALEWAARHLPGDQILWARAPSVALALVGLGLLAFILYRWYGRRSMVFGMLLVACSAWFLHVGRFAGPDIEYFVGVLALIAAHLALHDNEESKLAWYAWLVVNGLLLLIPGMIWFVLLSLVWQWRAVGRALSVQALWQWCLSALVPLVSLGWICSVALGNHSYVWTMLGLPANLSALRNVPHALWQTIQFFVNRGPNRPELWLGQLPILDLFVIAMFIAGAYFYGRHWRAERTQLLGGYILLGIVIVSFGVVSASVVVPIMYLVAVAGIAYVLHFWLRRFPVNPLARSLGIGAMCLLVALSCYYNVSHYFIAWPHNPSVVKVYRSTP